MNYPILIYDNLCTLCMRYAKFVNKILNGKITIIGYYTQQGKDLKQKIFPDNYDGSEMSWFVTEKKAYGGHKGLQQLIKYVLSKKSGNYPKNHFDLKYCNTDCGTVKNVMIRSFSILTSGKIIVLDK